MKDTHILHLHTRTSDAMNGEAIEDSLRVDCTLAAHLAIELNTQPISVVDTECLFSADISDKSRCEHESLSQKVVPKELFSFLKAF